MQLNESVEAAVQKIRSNQPIVYIVRFPLQSTLPKLMQVTVNGQELCSGSPEIGSFVTTIRLEHTVTVFSNGQQENFNFNNLNADKLQLYQRTPTTPSQMQLQNTATSESPEAQFLNHSIIHSWKEPTHQPVHHSLPDSEICGKSHGRFQITSLIVGGKRSSRGAWPWLVAINLKLPTGVWFICGGSLVSNRVVISAAHCFHTDEAELFSARDVVLFLGRFNRDEIEDESKMVEVEQLIIHSDYKFENEMSVDADVAILIMKESVEYTDYIRPICLWDGTSANEIVGKMGTVVGWGLDASGNPTAEPNMIDIPIVSEAQCLASNEGFQYITSERTFCAGRRDGTGPCHGDSGGGMSTLHNGRWLLVGIVSRTIKVPGEGSECSFLNNYVVFTDIPKFVNWIKNYV